MKYVDLLTTTADTKDNIVTFTSGDSANPTAWKDVSVMSSKEKHLSLLNKISTMFNNIRYLYKILGTTDISALGTVTQAISTIKDNIGDMNGISSSAAITVQGQYALDAREKNASIDGTLANELSKVNSNSMKYLGYLTEEQAADVLGLVYNYSAIYQRACYTCMCSFGGYSHFILGMETISGAGKKYGTQFAIANSGVKYRIKTDTTETFGEWVTL